MAHALLFASRAARATRTSDGLDVYLVDLSDDGTAAVIDGVIISPAGVVIPTGVASATLVQSGGKSFYYLIQSCCSTFGTSNTTGRTSLGSLAWLELGDKETDFTTENSGRGRLVTTKATSKMASTALVKMVTGYPPFKIYIRTYKPAKPKTALDHGGDDGVGDAEGEIEDDGPDSGGSEEDADAPAAGAGARSV